MRWSNSIWIGCTIVLLAVFQMVVIVDTIRKKPRASTSTTRTSTNLKRSTEQPKKNIAEATPTEITKDEHDEVEDEEDEIEVEIPTYTYSYSDDVEKDEEEGDGNSNESSRRTVYWLDHTAMSENYFSAAWLQPIEPFKSLNVASMNMLEDASHRVFYENKENVRQPVDWFDFAVEHLSRWYKKLDVLAPHHNSVAIDKITGNLLKYIEATPEKTKALSLASKSNKSKLPLLHPTIAVISHGAIVNDETSLTLERSKNLTTTVLGATITSLLRVGFGRIVVTGLNQADEDAALETFSLIGAQYESYGEDNAIVSTELEYVKITNKNWYKTEIMDVNRPRASLYGLNKALNGEFKNPEETKKWLGATHDPSYWKYVYSTEPDLILQTRATSLPAIHKALERGRVLMPHRLQPLTHEYDLIGPDQTKYTVTDNHIPAVGKFKDVMDLDGEVDMCCDGGKQHPKWDGKDDPTETPCHTWWFDCGYTSAWKGLGLSEEVKHRRLLYYTPLLRLNQGTNIISIAGSEHERKCWPRKRKTPDDVCQRPSPSGRSFAISEQDRKIE
mmetsp:Transcript_205/g.495  ORF Transcript_205/g.495 Transcript_205/m.495 type:complete len:559 (+) Transcript_205:124-1800(+)